MSAASNALSFEEFRALVANRGATLLALAELAANGGGASGELAGQLVGRLYAAATEIEELLDAYGARRNRDWHAFRQLVAPIKLFSNVSYILQHILRFLPSYELLPVDEDFESATHKALSVTCAAIRRASVLLCAEAKRLEIPHARSPLDPARYVDDFPLGQLAADRHSQKVTSPGGTVVHLATAFLNLSEESKYLHAVRERDSLEIADWIPEPISEARLRHLEERFHNLQALYDTHISDSNVESLDRDLPVLRGHISVVFHLLETATRLSHYCERHVGNFKSHNASRVIDPMKLLDVLINYSLDFSSRFILETRGLCQRMLQRYAITARVTVPVPRYRGFHVRPSTLIAKIVNHYGSEVTMELDDESYNAGFTLDLFRANEKLNAHKKRRLATEVAQMRLDLDEECQSPTCLVRRVVQALFEQNKVVLYERSIVVESEGPWQSESLEEYVVRAIVQLLTQGKIDIEADMNAIFVGDRRVLNDLQLLASINYGEDDFGNNLPLPEPLMYLRR